MTGDADSYVVASHTSGGEVGDTALLTPREREILALLARGCTLTGVATEFGLSPETVRVHTRSARRKLGATTTTQAVVLSVVMGEIDVPPGEPPDAAE